MAIYKAVDDVTPVIPYGVTSFRVESEAPSFYSENLNMKAQVFSRGIQRWKIEGKFSMLNQSEMKRVWSYITTMNGRLGTFYFEAPLDGTSGTNTVDTADVRATYAAGESDIQVLGLDGSLSAGDYVQFTNHDKVYLVTEDVDYNSPAGGTLGVDAYHDVILYPTLRTQITSTADMKLNKVRWKCRFERDINRYDMRKGNVHTMNFSLTEDL